MYTRTMTSKRLLLGAALLGASLTVPAVAKEGVRAKLDAPVRMDAAPGTMVRVAWRLVDPDGAPFGASGIYLRVSRCGQRPMRIRATATGNGHYVARVKVSKGRIRKLMVGLEGWRIIGERKERRDKYFQFDPPLGRRCP